MEKKIKIILRSFSMERDMYSTGCDTPLSKLSVLEAGAEFLESNAALSIQQEKRLKQMGTTVWNASSFLERLNVNQRREKAARKIMGQMSIERLSDLRSFYHMMERISSKNLDKD